MLYRQPGAACRQVGPGRPRFDAPAADRAERPLSEAGDDMSPERRVHRRPRGRPPWLACLPDREVVLDGRPASCRIDVGAGQKVMLYPVGVRLHVPLLGEMLGPLRASGIFPPARTPLSTQTLVHT